MLKRLILFYISIFFGITLHGSQYPVLPDAVAKAIDLNDHATVKHFLNEDSRNIEATHPAKQRTILMLVAFAYSLNNTKIHFKDTSFCEVIIRKPNLLRKDYKDRTVYDFCLTQNAKTIIAKVTQSQIIQHKKRHYRRTKKQPSPHSLSLITPSEAQVQDVTSTPLPIDNAALPDVYKTLRIDTSLTPINSPSWASKAKFSTKTITTITSYCPSVQAPPPATPSPTTSENEQRILLFSTPTNAIPNEHNKEPKKSPPCIQCLCGHSNACSVQ